MRAVDTNVLVRLITRDDQKQLLSHEHMTLQDPEVVAGALEHYRRKPSLGFSDCLILESARKAGHIPLGTFEKDLSQIAGAERILP